MIGTSFPYAEWLPKEGSCKCIEIDIDSRYIAHRYPVDVPLVGDSKATLQALIPHLERKKDRSWRKFLETEVKNWWDLMEQRAMLKGDPMNPQMPTAASEATWATTPAVSTPFSRRSTARVRAPRTTSTTWRSSPTPATASGWA
jgi:thiamine pyrophosphate-dependent acetolactate synthase large subunit-like protein